jgi:hypothetical protein
MSSCRMNPAPGSRPSATSSTTAAAEAAVVQEIARQARPFVSERDVACAVASGRDLNLTTAAELGTRGVVKCPADTTVQAAAHLMMGFYVRHLIVEDRTGPIGVVSARDLLGAYAS